MIEIASINRAFHRIRIAVSDLENHGYALDLIADLKVVQECNY